MKDIIKSIKLNPLNHLIHIAKFLSQIVNVFKKGYYSYRR